MLRLAVLDDSGKELYEISLRTTGMKERDVNSILHSRDPRSAYEQWIQRQAHSEDLKNADSQNVQEDIRGHLADLDKQIMEAKRHNYRLSWERVRD